MIARLSRCSSPVEVAVKMIHPHVEALVKTDMELLAGFASLVNKIPSMEILSLSELANEFADMMVRTHTATLLTTLTTIPHRIAHSSRSWIYA